MRRVINLRASVYRSICLLFVLLASACLALNAGRGWSQQYEEASLYINTNQQGTALVKLRLDLESFTEPPNQNIAIQSVSEAVGCKLDNVKVRQREGWLSVYGKCDRVFSRSGWLTKAEVNPAPLVQLLRPLNVKELAIQIEHPRTGLTDSSAANSSRELSKSYVNYSYNVPVGTATPAPLRVEFGYRPSDLVLIFAPLSAVLLLPLGLTFWMRQAALQVQKTDPAAVWFNYLRFLNWVIIGTWLVWLPVRLMSDVQKFINFALQDAASWQKVAVNVSLSFLPPAIAIVLCYAISHPVFAKVRGVEWTRSDLMRQAAYSQCATFLPLMLFIDGVKTLSEDLRFGVVLFAAAFASRVLFAQLSRKAQDLTLHALTVGELRDRIFDLAQKAGVKLQQVYLLPAGKGQLANAFASSGNIIMLSDYLLRQLSKREVDAIVAHELGHLKHKHPEALGRILVLAIFILIILAVILGIFLPWVPWYIVSGLLVIPVVYVFSRRFEYAADAEAVALSGDAEACITSLSKLTRLNLMPMQWGKLNEKMLTHPSTLRRVEAIAKRGNISPTHLQQILTAPNTTAEHYALPPSIISDEKVFSTSFKNNILFRIAWASIAVKTLTPALYLLLVQFALPSKANWAIYLGGLLVTIALGLVFSNYSAIWGYGELQRRLRLKLERSNIKPDILNGIFVGFAPDACPRVYENYSDWDVGFLFVAGDRIYYMGEQTSFALQQKQVTDVHLGAGCPGWLLAPRIYITWCDRECDKGGTFNLHPVGVRSLLQHKRQVRVLNQKLQAWHSHSADAIALPSPPAGLNTPEIATVTSISPRNAAKFGQFAANIYLLSLVALGVSIILQLPFTAGLYVIFVACLATVFQFIPYWRDRDIKGFNG